MGRRVVRARRQGGGRRPEHGYEAERALDLRAYRLVAMAVQDELRARRAEHRAKRRGVLQALSARHHAVDDRMVDQDDPEQALAPQAVQFGAQPFELVRPDPPRGRADRGGNRRTDVDQGDLAADPHSRKGDHVQAVAQPFQPLGSAVRHRHGHQGVVIAQRHGDAGRITQALQPGARGAVLGGRRIVGQIAGDRDMVGRLRGQVRHDGVKNFGLMLEPASPDP